MGLDVRQSIQVGRLHFELSESKPNAPGSLSADNSAGEARGRYVFMGRAEANSPNVSIHEWVQVLNDRRKIVSKWPIALMLLFFLFPFVAIIQPLWIALITFLIGLFGILQLRERDLRLKSSVVFYEFDENMAQWYEYLLSHVHRLTGVSQAWSVIVHNEFPDREFIPEASDHYKRRRIDIYKAEPPFLKTNVGIYRFDLDRLILYFFPDHILVDHHNHFSAISYKDLKLHVEAIEFRETSFLPRDAEIVGSDVEAVSRRNSQGRRYTRHRKIPVCRYEVITFSTPAGNLGVLKLSTCGYGEIFAEGLTQFGNALPNDPHLDRPAQAELEPEHGRQSKAHQS